MRQRIENHILLICNDVDLTTLSDIEVYIKQDELFFQYTPRVVSSEKMYIDMPLEDAMKLESEPVRVQFAFTDENGVPDASEIVKTTVRELLKEDGYGKD